MIQPDTNLLLRYVRGDRLALRVEADCNLLGNASQKPLISIVTEAELRALAREFGWGAKKVQDMERLLTYFDIVPIPFASIVDAYVEVSDFSRRAGRAMGKNDL